MEAQHKKLIILTAAAVAIFGISYYSFWQKISAPETASFNNPAARQAQAAQNSISDMAVIYISGAVNKPGVYKIASQLRVLDAVNSAGGLAPGADVAKVNLAQPVKDGMHVYVPLSGDKTVAGNAASQASDKININTADKASLEKLPGIGPALADRIIEYRKANGSFKAIADIKKVSGIGDAKYNQLKDKISI